MTEYYRQGDVVLATCEALPEGATPRKDKGDVVLKAGSATGHRHRFKKDGGAAVFQKDGKEYLQVTKKTASLLHEEHSTIKVPKGIYEILQQREHTAAGIRAVMD